MGRAPGLSSTTLVSRATGNGPGGNASSLLPAISANGRYVAFASRASNLRPGDKPNTLDIYRRDMKTGRVILVSRADGPNGVPVRDVYWTSISDDGQYVAFRQAFGDIFVRDVQSGTTTLASGPPDGPGTYANEPVISGDGRFVVFSSNEDLVPGTKGIVFIRDLVTGTADVVDQPTDGVTPRAPTSVGAGPADFSVSSNGRYIAFSSGERLTVDDDDAKTDVFVRDRVARTTIRIVPPGKPKPCHSEYPDISENGRYVAYQDCDGRIAVTNLATDKTERVSRRVDTGGAPSLSANGHRVAYVSAGPQDTLLNGNAGQEIFVVSITGGVTINASRGSALGLLGNFGSTDPEISSDGKFVAFTSRADGFSRADSFETLDIFRRELSFVADRPLPTCKGRTATALGTRGKDVITGSDGTDVIVGLAGADAISPAGGNDVVCGGAGDDRINSGKDDEGSDDRLFGGRGSDVVHLIEGGLARGGEGDDVVIGSATNDDGDYLYGDEGNDVLRGLANPDFLFGGSGDDDLVGGNGGDNLKGEGGDDLLKGGPGYDYLDGGAGHDEVHGGPGHNYLYPDPDSSPGLAGLSIEN